MTKAEPNATPILNDAEIRQLLENPPKDADLPAACLCSLAFSLQANQLRITFPHRLFATYYQTALAKKFEKFVKSRLGAHIQIIYDDLPEPPAAAITPDFQTADPFDDFLVSEKNALPLRAIRSCCESTAPHMLLLLCGPSGCGKSLLLSAMQNAIISRRGANAAHKCRAAAFQPEAEPEAYWAQPRALLLDDGHELYDNLAAQQQLTTFLDCALQTPHWHRVVIAFDTPHFDRLSKRLARRLQESLQLTLALPDIACRLHYAEVKCRELGLPKEHALALARHTRHISALKGLLQKLAFYGKLTGQHLTAAQIEKLALPTGELPDWQLILQQVAHKMSVAPAEILGQSRLQKLVRARQAAMYICRNKLGLSYPEIGRLFGGKDHSTVMHGINKIQELRKVDNDLHNLLTELENMED